MLCQSTLLKCICVYYYFNFCSFVLLFTSTPEAVKAFLRAMLPSLGFVLTSGEEFGRTARVEKAI